ncbi:MAG: sugar phosphate isomerase/epimerase family protein, partial [Ruminiclostridium sp.]
MFKYSYDALVYYGEKVDESIKRLAKFGYDAIELVGEPDYYNPKEVRKLCADYGIKVSSICSVYNSARDLAHPDLAKRRQAIDYVKKIADFSAEVGAPTMIVAPTACNKTQALASDVDEHKWAVEGMHEGGAYAAELNINLCIEAWNRYETYMCNRLDQAMVFMKDVNLPNVGIMGDTFHMNI